jgi:hypothetical protein
MLLPPLSQSGFANIHPHPLLAHRLDDDMHVRMFLVGMKDHGITVLQSELFLRESSHCGEELFSRSARRHRKDEVVYEPRRLATLRDGDGSLASMYIEIEIPAVRLSCNPIEFAHKGSQHHRVSMFQGLSRLPK